MTDNGPFDSEDQVRALPEVRAMHEAFRAGTGSLSGEPMILAACEAAGVELGAFDRRIVAWLGNWEPSTCAVIAKLIMRAYEAGRQAGPGETGQ